MRFGVCLFKKTTAHYHLLGIQFKDLMNLDHQVSFCEVNLPHFLLFCSIFHFVVNFYLCFILYIKIRFLNGIILPAPVVAVHFLPVQVFLLIQKLLFQPRT